MGLGGLLRSRDLQGRHRQSQLQTADRQRRHQDPFGQSAARPGQFRHRHLPDLIVQGRIYAGHDDLPHRLRQRKHQVSPHHKDGERADPQAQRSDRHRHAREDGDEGRHGGV